MVVQMNGDLKQREDALIDEAYKRGYEDGFKAGEKHKESVLLDTNPESSNKECIDCMYWGMNECQNPAICKNNQYWQAKVDDYTEDNKISIAAFDQVLWERDVAVDQLKQLGYGFGEKPRTGRWVDNTNGTFTCDQCGCKHSKSNYCPNCGIKMMENKE